MILTEDNSIQTDPLQSSNDETEHRDKKLKPNSNQEAESQFLDRISILTHELINEINKRQKL